jgi:hypothetical protein
MLLPPLIHTFLPVAEVHLPGVACAIDLGPERLLRGFDFVRFGSLV